MLLHQYFSFNSPVWFNVGTASPQQVSACFILSRRRLDGLDPELVPRGGLHLQGRLRRRPEPVPDPLVQGAAQLRRHRLRPGLVHARRGRQRRDDQVRRRHPSGRQDGRARRRPPRHRGVHRDQGARGEQDPRAARRRASTWTSAAATSPRSSTRTPTTPSGSATSSCGPSRTASTFGLRARTRQPGDRDRRRRASCSARSPRRPGPAPTPASSTTTRSTTGTPTPRPAGSPRPTRARST